MLLAIYFEKDWKEISSVVDVKDELTDYFEMDSIWRPLLLTAHCVDGETSV